MMLIPSAYQQLPSTQGCFNGRLLFGGTVSQMASALAQMTRAKALSEAHYHIGSSVLNSTGGRERLGVIEKSGQDVLTHPISGSSSNTAPTTSEQPPLLLWMSSSEIQRLTHTLAV
jgi:hypothetical protein